MINLHKLDVFTQVVQAGSFSRAAERLLMTQSAVSQHIRDLETTLGASLFVRGPRGVTLTPSGETLHEYVLEIFKLLSEAENAVTNVKNLAAGRITIGATPGVSVYWLPEWVRAFRATYPNLVAALLTGTSPQILDDLRTGRSRILALLKGKWMQRPRPGWASSRWKKWNSWWWWVRIIPGGGGRRFPLPN